MIWRQRALARALRTQLAAAARDLLRPRRRRPRRSPMRRSARVNLVDEYVSNDSVSSWACCASSTGDAGDRDAAAAADPAALPLVLLPVAKHRDSDSLLHGSDPGVNCSKVRESELCMQPLERERRGDRVTRRTFRAQAFLSRGNTQQQGEG